MHHTYITLDLKYDSKMDADITDFKEMESLHNYVLEHHEIP
jgi:hypothetical protein